MPYVMCIKDTRGTADEKAQYCIKEMITCLETHCEKTPGRESNIKLQKIMKTDKIKSAVIY